MILQICTVGRKTPSDGMLEISAATAQRLRFEKAALIVQIGAARAPADVVEISCDCAKSVEGRHVHHFLCAPMLRELTAGETTVLDLVAPGLVEVGRPHPLSG